MGFWTLSIVWYSEQIKCFGNMGTCPVSCEKLAEQSGPQIQIKNRYFIKFTGRHYFDTTIITHPSGAWIENELQICQPVEEKSTNDVTVKKYSIRKQPSNQPTLQSYKYIPILLMYIL
jgi:hypothetical protein